MRLAVVGGGITGLAAAWEARLHAEVTVYEPGLLGGCLRSETVGGTVVDCGPDAFLTRVPQAVALVAELGLTEELVAPATAKALIWTGGRLVALPSELVLGVPRGMGPVLRSGLLSPLGSARAALDLVLPARSWAGDVTVADLVSARFGHEVADRLVGPLVGSIHAGSIATLSAAATVPQLLGAARSSRSLMLALRSGSARGSEGPLFLAPRGGMGVLVERLVASLRAAGVRFVARAALGALRRPDGGITLELGPGGTGGTGETGTGPGQSAPAAGEVCDAVVLAVPAGVAARLLGTAAPEGLDSIEAASVALATLRYAPGDLRLPQGASGLLVPAGQGRLMTACSFSTTKWPQRSVDGATVVRVSTGRDGDDSHTLLDDDELVARLGAEVAEATGSGARPAEARVHRWPRSFPQYRVGHLDLVGRIEACLLRDLPGVRLAGASYRGAGIPACIASGRAAAAALVEDGTAADRDASARRTSAREALR